MDSIGQLFDKFAVAYQHSLYAIEQEENKANKKREEQREIIRKQFAREKSKSATSSVNNLMATLHKLNEVSREINQEDNTVINVAEYLNYGKLCVENIKKMIFSDTSVPCIIPFIGGKNIMLKSKVMMLTRQFFAKEGFLEIETPMLGKSTPEGARDYLVPSRVHPGHFYGLPQSPQLYKQLLMCSGYDRYIQIARCFRDEDLRADRQPEFTQIDMELSFVDVDDVIDVNERFLAYLFKEVLDIDVKLPIQRITWQEAMDRFGSDKPDMRFGMELHDVSDVVKNCGFSVFTSALENGGSVRGINAEGQGAMPRKKIDKLVEFAKGYGAKGLAYIAIAEDGTRKSSFAKFMTDEEMDALVAAMDGKAGDLLLFAADKKKLVYDVLGALRLELAKQMKCEKKQIIAGYRDCHTFLREEFEAAGTLYIATEDGSVGTKGNVMDAIRENALEADVIYACGPTPMLRAIKKYAEENGIECYISLEERMACGIGACLACVCKSREKDAHSNVNNKRICKDGPVFLSTEVEI